MAVLPVGFGASGGYTIDRSLRFRASASAYLSWTPASAGNRKTWTWSGWVKRGKLGTVSRIFSADDGSASTDQDYNSFFFNPSDQLQFGGNLTNFRVTTAVYRDPSSWYHIVLVTDTTQATSANRFKLYVNGVEVTAFGTANNPSQNTDLAVNATIGHYIGAIPSGNYLDGYLTEVNFIDGQALTPSSFGETDTLTGVWKPKKYAGTYGTNGFYLNFSDNSNNTAATIGKDYSGNGNNWTPNNISVTTGSTYDSMLDVPTMYADGGNGRGNYVVLDALEARSNRIPPTDGNLSLQLASGTNAYFGSPANFQITSGKWYWEANIGTISGAAGQWAQVGIINAPLNWPSGTWVGGFNGGFVYINDGWRGTSGGGTPSTSSTYGATWTSGDVIGVAFDADAGTLTFYKNGVSQGTAFTNIGGISNGYIPCFEFYRSTSVAQSMFPNFGQRPFAYTPPTGFKALNTYNLPDSTVKDGSKQFNPVLYTGNGSTQSITGVGFQPDFVWVKGRNNAGNHLLADTVRGALKSLASNTTNAETDPDTNGLTSFDVDGFSAGSATRINGSGNTYVAWNWKANGSGVSNTDGSITSTVSANTTAGFSIVTYTGNGTAGATIGHGLGVAPSMVIYKCRGTPTSVNGNWLVWHRSISQAIQSSTNIVAGSFTGATYLNLTSASGSYGFDNQIGENGKTYVAYCFAEVEGFSKMGSYTGNGSTDGPFVYTGFRPAFVMVKRTDTTASWAMMDTSRDIYNAAGLDLYPNLSNAEGDDRPVLDILSNGFKLRSTYASTNASGGTYIFMAFAESPFKVSLAR